MCIRCSLAFSFTHEWKPHRRHHKNHWLNTNTTVLHLMSAAERPSTRKHIPSESMIFSQEQTAWVLQEEGKYSNHSDNLEYSATSCEKNPLARNKTAFKLKIKNKTQTSGNYRTPLYSCSCVVTEKQARVPNSSPCKELLIFHRLQLLFL